MENKGFKRCSAKEYLGSGLKLRDGWCVWVTGLPGSGKSVVSGALLKLLEEKGIHTQLLSSDALRKVLTPKPKYTLKEREIVYATLVYIAKLLTQNGVNVVIDATGNLRRYRENARKQIPCFIEAYLECPLEVCMEREAKRGKTYQAPKQIYAKALEGKAPTVPGIGEPYEPSLNPEITIDTTKYTPEECAQKILNLILSSDKLPSMR
jgi:adenylylsulfate kinase